MSILSYPESAFFVRNLFNIPKQAAGDNSEWHLVVIHEMTACYSITFATARMLESFEGLRKANRSNYEYAGIGLESLYKPVKAEMVLLQQILHPHPFYERRFIYDAESLVLIILLLQDRAEGYHRSGDGFSYQINQLSTALEQKEETSKSRGKRLKRLAVQLRQSQEEGERLRIENQYLKEALALSKREGYVYLIRGNNNTWKIGRTKNPANRMETFKTKLPFDVEFEHLIPCEDMYQLERDLHQRYADKRVNGEWFALLQEDIDYIKTL